MLSLILSIFTSVPRPSLNPVYALLILAFSPFPSSFHNLSLSTRSSILYIGDDLVIGLELSNVYHSSVLGMNSYSSKL